MIARCLIIFFLTHTLYGIQAEGNGDYDAPKKILLYHTTDHFPNQQWVEHGKITILNIETEKVLISQPVIDEVMKKRFDEKLSSISSDDFFTMKSVVKTSKGKEIPFYSSFTLKALFDAGHILIAVYLDKTRSITSIVAYPAIQQFPSFLNIEVSFWPDTLLKAPRLKPEMKKPKVKEWHEREENIRAVRYTSAVITFIMMAYLVLPEWWGMIARVIIVG